jgi:hypothetical protein
MPRKPTKPVRPPIDTVRSAIHTIEAALGDDHASEPPEVAVDAYQLGAMHALQWATGDNPSWGKRYGL